MISIKYSVYAEYWRKDILSSPSAKCFYIFSRSYDTKEQAEKYLETLEKTINLKNIKIKKRVWHE